MQKLFIRTIVVVAVVTAMVASPALAAPWTTPSGNVDTVFGDPLSFSYSNGGDLNGLFGDPSVIFDDAFFFTTSFLAQASNGASNPVSDTLSVDILANPGLKFGSISVGASGSYAINTAGSVDVAASLSLTENTGLLRTFSSALATDVAFPISTPGGSTFTGNALVDVGFEFPVPSNSLHIELANNILAISGPGGSATVNIQFQDLRLGFNVIPEPASASLLMVGLFAAVARRRRRC